MTDDILDAMIKIPKPVLLHCAYLLFIKRETANIPNLKHLKLKDNRQIILHECYIFLSKILPGSVSLNRSRIEIEIDNTNMWHTMAKYKDHGKDFLREERDALYDIVEKVLNRMVGEGRLSRSLVGTRGDEKSYKIIIA